MSHAVHRGRSLAVALAAALVASASASTVAAATQSAHAAAGARTAQIGAGGCWNKPVMPSWCGPSSGI